MTFLPSGGVDHGVRGHRVGRPTRGRLLISGSGSAAANMAIDAAILDCASSQSPLTLRFYAWQEPTLSLGYFQSIAARSLHRDSLHLPVVRRGTGGGAIIHDRELTYSLFVPAAAGSPSAPSFYRVVHEAIAECLSDFGIRSLRFADSGQTSEAEEPFLCFQRRTDEDLIVNRYKVLGSAQRRGRCGVLQHGSLLLAASRSASQLPGIAELCGRCIGPSELFEPIAENLSERFGIQWELSKLSDSERAAAVGPLAEKFVSDRWLNRR